MEYKRKDRSEFTPNPYRPIVPGCLAQIVAGHLDNIGMIVTVEREASIDERVDFNDDGKIWKIDQLVLWHDTFNPDRWCPHPFAPEYSLRRIDDPGREEQFRQEMINNSIEEVAHKLAEHAVEHMRKSIDT